MDIFSENNLKKGIDFSFNNDEFCQKTQSEEFIQVQISYREYPRHSWATGFKIESDFKTESFKTFKGLKNKLNKLMGLYNLVQVESEN